MKLPSARPAISRRLLFTAVGVLGATSVMTQLALMRELLGAFSGNELVLGISLGSWLLLTAAGAWVGKLVSRGETESGARLLPVGFIGIAIVPLAQVVAVRVLRDFVFTRGAAAGPVGTLLATFALLLPFCLLSGSLLTAASGWLSRRGMPSAVAGAYVADCAGSIAGGLCFTFVLASRFDHFALLCFPAALNLIVAGCLAWSGRCWLILASDILIAGGLALHLALIDADAITTAVQFWGRSIAFHGNSPYGRLVVAADSGQLTFFENGQPLFTAGDACRIEETVHYAMSQRPDAHRVLLIGSGVSGTALEILRHNPGRVVYVEIDPLVVEQGRRFLPGSLADPRIATAADDGRRFVQRTQERFDIVIVAVADPSTIQLNRFYTSGFFAEVRRILNPRGVLSFALGRYENYVSPELAQLLSSAHRTARSVFAHVRMIPGGQVYFLASDGPLSLDIAARLGRRGLSPRLVNRHYLDAMLAPDRLADLDRAVARPARLNTDLSPALLLYHLRHWLSQFPSPLGLLGAGLLALLVVPLVRLRAVPRLIFTAGFAASTLEVVLLLGFQTLYGSVYRQVGLVVAVFMAGLAAGAAWGIRKSAEAAGGRRALPVLGFAIATLAALLPVFLTAVGILDAASRSSILGQGLILGLTFVLAILIGAPFPLAAAFDPGEPQAVASRLYAADLAGAACGALLASAILIPLLGVVAVCLITAGLNLAAAAVASKTISPA